MGTKKKIFNFEKKKQHFLLEYYNGEQFKNSKKISKNLIF